MPFELVQGGKDAPGFVCTWCGYKAISRDALGLHWETDPRCKANRLVNNPTQTKYNVREAEPSDE